MSKDLLSVVSNLQQLTQNMSIVISVGACVVGVTLVGYSALRLHTKLTEDDFTGNSPNHWGCVAGIVLGSLITISSVVISTFGLLYG